MRGGKVRGMLVRGIEYNRDGVPLTFVHSPVDFREAGPTALRSVKCSFGLMSVGLIKNP